MLQIEPSGEQSFAQSIAHFESKLNVQGLLDEGAAILLYNVRRRFIQEIAPDGAAWIPSKAAQERAAWGLGGGTLYDTGRLFHSIQLFAKDETSRTIGTDVPYAGFVNYGTIKLPARVYMAFNSDDVELVEAMVARRVNEALSA